MHRCSIAPFLLILLALSSAANDPLRPLATIVSLERPSCAMLEKFLTKCSGREFNHDWVGCTSLLTESAEPQGWTELEYGAVVGHGRACYDRVSRAMEKWQVLDKEWAGMHYQQSTGMLATFAKLQIGVGWAINPCRQSYLNMDAVWNRRALQGAGSHVVGKTKAVEGAGAASELILTQMAYATLQGHLLQGEERFLVTWDGQEAQGLAATKGHRGQGAAGEEQGRGEVCFSVRSVSRGNGVLGSLIFPLLRPMQRRFF